MSFCVGDREYPGTIVDLPCIIESQKTFDNSAYYKSADICQVMLVTLPNVYAYSALSQTSTAL